MDLPDEHSSEVRTVMLEMPSHNKIHSQPRQHVDIMTLTTETKTTVTRPSMLAYSAARLPRPNGAGGTDHDLEVVKPSLANRHSKSSQPAQVTGCVRACVVARLLGD